LGVRSRLPLGLVPNHSGVVGGVPGKSVVGSCVPRENQLPVGCELGVSRGPLFGLGLAELLPTSPEFLPADLPGGSTRRLRAVWWPWPCTRRLPVSPHGVSPC